MNGDGGQIRNNGHQFPRNTFGISDVRDNEGSHVGKGANRFCEVSTGWFNKINQNRDVIALSEFVTNRIENDFSVRRETPENQDNFGGDCVNDVPDSGIAQK
jgi:hypothetical protein